MKYRVTNTRPFPLTLYVPGAKGEQQPVVLSKQGDTATVDVPEAHAEKIARRGAAKFEKFEDVQGRREKKPFRSEPAEPVAESAATTGE